MTRLGVGLGLGRHHKVGTNITAGNNASHNATLPLLTQVAAGILKISAQAAFSTVLLSQTTLGGPVIAVSASQVMQVPEQTATLTLNPELVPAIADQTVALGARTLTNAGDRPIVNTGGLITSATIDSGNTGSDLTIAVVNGVAVIRSAQDGNLLSSYTLGVTVTGPAGSDSATITVQCSGNDAGGRDLSKAFSVAGMQQLKNVLTRTSAPVPAFGDYILCSGGSYDGIGTVGECSRSVAFSGVFNAPDKYLPVNGTQPVGHKGRDLYTRADDTPVNWLYVTPHHGESVTINRLFLQCTSGSVAAFKGLHVGPGLTFSRTGTPQSEYEPDISVTTPDQYNAGYLMMRNNVWSDVCVKGNTFQGLQTPDGTVADTYIGILTTANFPRLYVRDNTFDTVWNACHIGTGADVTHDDLEILKNTVSKCWSDVFFLKHGDRVKVNWNTVYNCKQAYIALRFWNTTALIWDTSLHKDMIHCRATTKLGTTKGADSCQFIGNRGCRGTGVSASYPSRTPDGPSNYDAEAGVSIFIENPSETGAYTNLIVAGNQLIGDSPQRKIVVNRCTSGVIEGNLVVTHDPGNYGGTLLDAEIWLNTGSANVVCRYNIVEASIRNNGTGNTTTPNTIISRTAPSGALSKTSTFVSAQAQQGAEIADLGTFTHFALKAGSEADVASPKHGPWGVDYANQDLALSWYA